MSSKHLRGVKPKITADLEPLTKVPKAPTYFSPYAVAEWKRVLPVLVARKVICTADLAQVETYCCMAGLVRQIETERQLAGGVVDVKLFGVQNRAAQTARQIAATLGLDPVSRARMGAGQEGGAGDTSPDPLAI
ncbi:P27 family phage terminase small subunit [Fuscibacter oryzae]|uniref:P27 family phage terminase small subunit n=1 Tax=Fuscibacter oryzae TaxID=2803939 RepID=UPI002E2B08D3|nr:P27 family phage terminase small subunit [Fuscibacter oryzae]